MLKWLIRKEMNLFDTFLINFDIDNIQMKKQFRILWETKCLFKKKI